mmetsp:Transcript_27627/g.27314  ORF Transcript_27627/g.27314 Transcript_27627/m.27314 type:complete len:294 (-) Transcript_27627:3-884(-)
MEAAETLKGDDVCPMCNLIMQEGHSCLHSLRNAVISLKKVIYQQNKRIQFLLESTQSLQAKPEDKPELLLFKDFDHETVACDGCGSFPIIGVRYKCKECADYDLCQKCRNSTPHRHSDFFILTTNKSHEGKNCLGCLQSPIRGVMYHCNECNCNHCHNCVKEKGHNHMNVEPIIPLDIRVETFLNKPSGRYKQGDNFKITFVIQNLSTQKIRKLLMIITKGLPPFKFNQKEADVDMELCDIRQLDYEGKITGQAGKYEIAFRFFSVVEEEYIGPEIPVTIYVPSGFLSGIFKG